jgi:hypothetical protein
LGGGRLPLVEEVQDVFGSHGAGSFEFAVLLAEEEFAVGIEDGKSGDAAVERNIIFLGDVEVLVVLADVDMDDEEGFVEGRSDFRVVEGFVENVAIEAPVAAKDDENVLMGSGGRMESFGDVLVGVGVGGINILLLKGLTKTSDSRALGEAEKPLASDVDPTLSHGDILLFESGAIFGRESELENQDVKVGLGVVFLDELGREIGKALGFPGGPEGKFVAERDGLIVRSNKLRIRRLDVKRGKSGRVAGENSGTPFFEGSVSGRGSSRLPRSDGSQKRSE